MKKATKKEVTKSEALGFVKTMDAINKTKITFGIQNKRYLIRNVESLKAMARELEAAIKEGYDQEEKLRRELAMKDDEGNPVELPAEPGTVRYRYSKPNGQVQEAIQALGCMKQIQAIGEESEKIGLYVIPFDEIPEEAEPYLDGLKVIIDDF